MRLNAALSLIRAAVLAATLFLMGSLVPLLGSSVMVCAPAPLLIASLGQNSATSRLTAGLLLSVAMVGLVGGVWQGVGFVLSLGLAAVLMFVLLRWQVALERIVLAVTMLLVVSAGVALLLWAGSPQALLASIGATLGNATAHADQFYQKLGLDMSDSRQINARVIALTLRLLPALAAIATATAVLFNLALVWRWLGRQGLGYALFQGVTKWRAPEWMIWLLLATGFGLFIPFAPAKLVASNGFLFIAAIYFCQGLAIMAYYFQALAMPTAARALIYLITFVQPVLAALVCLAGVFDLWVDFRRLKPPSQEAGSLDDFF